MKNFPTSLRTEFHVLTFCPKFCKLIRSLLQTLTTMANNLTPLVRTALSVFIRMLDSTPFKKVTVHDFLSGYDDALTSLANTYFPKGKRPPKQMGLFLSVSRVPRRFFSAPIFITYKLTIEFVCSVTELWSTKLRYSLAKKAGRISAIWID